MSVYCRNKYTGLDFDITIFFKSLIFFECTGFWWKSNYFYWIKWFEDILPSAPSGWPILLWYLLLGTLTTVGGGLSIYWSLRCKAFSEESLFRNRFLGPDFELIWTELWVNLKKFWCSLQHFHICLHAILLDSSKPYVFSSFWVNIQIKTMFINSKDLHKSIWISKKKIKLALLYTWTPFRQNTIECQN